MDRRHARPALPEFFSEHFGPVLDDVFELADRKAASIVPRLVESAVKSLPDEEYTQRSYNVFLIGDGPSSIPAQAGTLSVPLRDDMYLEALDILRDTARKLAVERGRYQTGAISVRFVKGSRAMLGDPEDVCKFEIILAGNNDRIHERTAELMDEFYRALYARFGDNVRAHFGHTLPSTLVQRSAERIPASFPRYQKWREIRDRFDPRGRFLNSWNDQIFPAVR